MASVVSADKLRREYGADVKPEGDNEEYEESFEEFHWPEDAPQAPPAPEIYEDEDA